MQLHDLLLTVTAFVSEVLGTLSGFGSSTFFVPAGSYFESFKLILALTAILHCFGNTAKLIVFRGRFDWRLFAKLALPSIILVFVGAALVPFVDLRILKRALGITLILVSIMFLFKRAPLRRFPQWLAVALSGLSGFCTGIVGTGGAIRGIALAALNIEKASFISLSAAIDFGGDFVRMVVYLANGYMDWSQWYYLPLLGLAAWLGAHGGKWLLGFTNQQRFEKIVALFVMMSGLLLLLETDWRT